MANTTRAEAEASARAYLDSTTRLCYFHMLKTDVMSNLAMLAESVQRLYRCFSRYRLQTHVEGCPCCVSKYDRRSLESRPLGQLTVADLGKYAFKAMTTWGNQDDFRHFLPRILELLVSDGGIGCDEEVVLGKLALAGWMNWPEQEQNAVREFFRAGWRSLLAQSQPITEPDSWLCGMARAGEALEEYLEDWVDFRSTTAYRHLVDFVEWHQPTYIKRHSLNNPFWPDAPEGVAQICGWLTSRKTREKLEEIYFQNQSAEFAPTLAAAADCVTRIQSV